MTCRERVHFIWLSLVAAEWAGSVVQIDAEHGDVRHVMSARVSTAHARLQDFTDGSHSQVTIYLEENDEARFFEARLMGVTLWESVRLSHEEYPKFFWGESSVPYRALPKTGRVTRLEMPWTTVLKRAVTIVRFCWNVWPVLLEKLTS